ncbi:MAG: hypothetical protein KIT14_20255 [bacterium]|nr:hypothetical protein [bacterium]
MRCRLGLILGVLLVTPPYGVPPPWGSTSVGCNDPGHLSECAPLSMWRVRGSYPDVVACRRERDARIAAATDDVAWAELEHSRCLPEERVRRGGALLPGE